MTGLWLIEPIQTLTFLLKRSTPKSMQSIKKYFYNVRLKDVNNFIEQTSKLYVSFDQMDINFDGGETKATAQKSLKTTQKRKRKLYMFYP